MITQTIEDMNLQVVCANLDESPRNPLDHPIGNLQNHDQGNQAEPDCEYGTDKTVIPMFSA
jgi:hypothetical protein